MPCIFLENIPGELRDWDPRVAEELYETVAGAVGVSVDHVEVHRRLPDGRWVLIGSDGKERPHPSVHSHVEWFAGRTDKAKGQIGGAIHEFLDHHGLGKDSDTAFHDYPAGSFYFNGERVPGRPPQDKPVDELIRDLEFSEWQAEILRVLTESFHDDSIGSAAQFVEFVDYIKRKHPCIYAAFRAYRAGWETRG